ncbi:MmgE/PrpD family protein [Pseudonocardia broussonetiae]|uniref:MmgE/PrpD N-terminal domain-containing protein n=1 Tax=Pseudonocardia broussonetiae TaxID=2736640 RepID=A0A6M6JLI3_9PSEU|nr:MmgE/PrpD family protein [Pseudonocardia broussonetiae]QJY48226.1 hypothetical protein HOP40_22510 [Pseudonocardia broussonetiae]
MTLLTDLSARARAAARDADALVLAEAARHVLDTAACVASGSTHPLAARWVPLLPTAPDGVAALGAPGAWAVETAVEIDATLAHVDEFDPLHGPAAVAPGAVVVPAALHVGRALGASGPDVLRAVVAGYEAVAEASLRFGGPALYRAGWWPTALFGALGAAAATALLLDLDGPATTTALALASAPLGGLLSADDLGDAHYLLCGRAAAHGVRSARGAAAGLTGSATLLDAGPPGPPGPPSPPGPPHLVGTALKSWPCARPLHTALAALEELGADGADGPVRIALPTAALRFVTGERQPSGPAEAAASAAVAVAGARAGRARDPGWYRDPGAAADVVLDTDPDLDAAFPARWGAVVTVGGVSRRVLVAPGDPDRPLSAGALRAKASRLLGTARDDPRTTAVLGLAGAPLVAPVLDGLLAAAGPARPAADGRGTLVRDDVPPTTGPDEEARWRARPGGAARP